MPALTDLTRSRMEAAEIGLAVKPGLPTRRVSGTDQRSVALARSLSPIIFYSLLALLPLTAIPYGSVEPWWVAFFECAVFLIALLGIADAFFGKEIRVADAKLFVPLLALTLFVFFQSALIFPGSGQGGFNVAISADPYGTKLFAVKLLALMVFGFLLLRHASDSRRLRTLIYVVISVGLAVALFGIIRKGFQHEAGFLLPGLPHNDRGFAQFINRNHFAFLIEMTLGLSLGLFIGESDRQKKILFLLPATLLLWVALVISNSRGGILASLCQLLFLGLLFDPMRHLFRYPEGKLARLQNLVGGVALRVFLGACLVAVFAYGVIWIGGESVVTNFELAAPNFSQQGADDRENTSRKQIWSSTWQAFKANPIVGVGAGGYWIAIRKYHDATGAYTPQEAHNDYLELFASGGIIGTLLVLWFVVMFLKRARQTLKSGDSFQRAATLGALAGLFGVAIHSFVDFGLHITSNALIACALMVIAVERPGRSLAKNSHA